MYGSNFGTKIIVIINANIHFKKDMRLKKNLLQNIEKGKIDNKNQK